MKTIIVSLLVALSAPLMAGDSPILNFKKARPVVFRNLFDTYDKNGDELIDWAEFQGTVGTSNVTVITEWRFLYMADGFIKTGLVVVPSGSKGGELGIDLETYVRFAGGLRVPAPTRFDIFELADKNSDNFLDPAEYASTRKGSGNFTKGFNKLDKDDDSLISRAEFGLIIKA